MNLPVPFKLPIQHPSLPIPILPIRYLLPQQPRPQSRPLIPQKLSRCHDILLHTLLDIDRRARCPTEE